MSSSLCRITLYNQNLGKIRSIAHPTPLIFQAVPVKERLDYVFIGFQDEDRRCSGVRLEDGFPWGPGWIPLGSWLESTLFSSLLELPCLLLSLADSSLIADSSLYNIHLPVNTCLNIHPNT